MILNAKARLRQIHKILESRDGGINKRVDENRELRHLLRTEGADFLAKHSWVEGWLSSNDDFFAALDEAAGPHENLFREVRAWEDGQFPSCCTKDFA